MVLWEAVIADWRIRRTLQAQLHAPGPSRGPNTQTPNNSPLCNGKPLYDPRSETPLHRTGGWG